MVIDLSLVCRISFHSRPACDFHISLLSYINKRRCPIF